MISRLLIAGGSGSVHDLGTVLDLDEDDALRLVTAGAVEPVAAELAPEPEAAPAMALPSDRPIEIADIKPAIALVEERVARSTPRPHKGR